MLESKKGKKKLTETDSSIEKCWAGRDAKFTRTLKLKYFKHERAWCISSTVKPTAKGISHFSRSFLACV